MKTFKKGHTYRNKNQKANGMVDEITAFMDTNVDDYRFSQYEDVTEKDEN